MSTNCRVAEDLIQMQMFLEDDAISEIDMTIDFDLTELDIDELVESLYGTSARDADYCDHVRVSQLAVIHMAIEPTKNGDEESVHPMVHTLRADTEVRIVTEANAVTETDAGAGANSCVVPSDAIDIDCLLYDIDDGADRVVLDMPEPVVEHTPLFERSSTSRALKAFNTDDDLKVHLDRVPAPKTGRVLNYCGPPPHCDYCGPPPRCDWSPAALR
jgi:hypothetical protein